jgi:hypothetical protein
MSSKKPRLKVTPPTGGGGEASATEWGQATPPAPTAGLHMAIDPPAPSPGARSSPVLSPAEQLLRILAGLHDDKALSVDDQVCLGLSVYAFLGTINPLLLPGQRFVLQAKPAQEAVQPAGHTATVTKPVTTPKPPTRTPAKAIVPKLAPNSACPTYAEKARPKPSPPLKHLQQGTKASQLVLRPDIATKDCNSAKAIYDECERLEFIQDGTLSITEIDWTMHGDLRISARQPIPPDQMEALTLAVAKYCNRGDIPAIQNRPTVSALKFTLVPRMTRSGRDTTPALLESQLRLHPAWKEVELLRPPRFCSQE